MIRDKKILVVDDEVVIAEHLKVILNSLDFNNIELVHDKESAFESIELFTPDIILLDIRMESELDGIEIAEFINSNYKMPFIFITAHSDSEILSKALITSPAAYITKPFKKTDIFAAINIAIKNSPPSKNEFLSFKDGYEDVKLNVHSILYVESEGNYIDINCIDKKYTIRNSLEWFIENVPNKHFIRIHRSYVVNLNEIKKTTSKVVIIGNITIPVSRKNLGELKNRIAINPL